MRFRYIDAEHKFVQITKDDGNSIVLAYHMIPDPSIVPDPYIAPDWRPDAIAAFNVMRKNYMDTLTSMQVDYRDQNKTDNAEAVLAAKQALKDLDKSPPVLQVYTDPNATREQFNLAVKQAWYAAIGTAPAEVLSDFPKYGGNAL